MNLDCVGTLQLSKLQAPSPPYEVLTVSSLYQKALLTETMWDDTTTNSKRDDNPASTTAPADSNDDFFAEDKIESGHNCSRHSSSEHVLVM